ncbi:MAG: twin-arginine translocation signal domain-containing protein [Hyphomicrobiaceae bacterium]
MKHSDKKADQTNRRSFLKLAGAGVAGGGAAIVGSVVPAAAEAAPEAVAEGGYRESDHIKRYYQLAKFM